MSQSCSKQGQMIFRGFAEYFRDWIDATRSSESFAISFNTLPPKLVHLKGEVSSWASSFDLELERCADLY